MIKNIGIFAIFVLYLCLGCRSTSVMWNKNMGDDRDFKEKVDFSTTAYITFREENSEYDYVDLSLFIIPDTYFMNMEHPIGNFFADKDTLSLCIMCKENNIYEIWDNPKFVIKFLRKTSKWIGRQDIKKKISKLISENMLPSLKNVAIVDYICENIVLFNNIYHDAVLAGIIIPKHGKSSQTQNA